MVKPSPKASGKMSDLKVKTNANFKNSEEFQKDLAENGFDHPCKQTCSGWKQGYEKGAQAEKAKAQKLLEVAKELQGQAMRCYGGIEEMKTNRGSLIPLIVHLIEAIREYENG